MARLEWGITGERLFEAGIDRGVLYVGANAGEAWSGLVSVTESNSNTAPRPFYIDGYKYLNLDSSGDFQATLSAFSAPSGFASCEGQNELYAGLFATAQRRKEFHLSYRTMIGNDLSGVDHGYKIHLVYNCLASPSDSAYATAGDTPAPVVKSWGISTRPPLTSGLRPTAHFVVDSTKVDVSDLEDILYGSVSTDAAMPTVEELLALFAS